MFADYYHGDGIDLENQPAAEPNWLCVNVDGVDLVDRWFRVDPFVVNLDPRSYSTSSPSRASRTQARVRGSVHDRLPAPGERTAVRHPAAIAAEQLPPQPCARAARPGVPAARS